MLFRPKARTEEFEAVAMPHRNDIFRTAVSMLGNRSEAEDLAQEVFLQAWKSFDRFEAGTNCRAWLFKILFHRLHHYRRKKFRFRFTDDETAADRLAYAEPVAEKLTDEEILQALDRLRPDYRAVVLLADVEELAYKEVAAALDIPIGTVMSRLSRARQALRAELAEAADAMGIRKPASAGGEG